MEAVRLSRFANISYCHCCFLEVLKYMFLFGDFLEQNEGVMKISFQICEQNVCATGLRATGRAALFSFLGSFQFAGLAIKALSNKVQSQSHSFLLRFLAQHFEDPRQRIIIINHPTSWQAIPMIRN